MLYLTPHLPLTPSQSKHLEADLLHLLALEGIDVSAALIAQSAYLRLLAVFLAQARAEAKIDLDADPAANDPFLERFSSNLRAGEDGRPWGRLLRSGEREGSAGRLRRVVLGSVLASLQTPGSAPGTFARYMLFALGRGRVDFGPAVGRHAYRRLRAVPLGLDRAAIQTLLREACADALEGNALLAYDTVCFSHHMMLIGYGLAQWAAAALALRDGRPAPDDEYWTAALDFSEGAVGRDSDFPALLERNGALRTILETLTERPHFPFAMARPD